MIQPVTFLRKDHCTYCNSDKAIECFSTSNKQINYSFLLNKLESGQDIDDILKNTELSYMKCKNCGRRFRINWNIEKIPVPMYDDTFYNYFMSFYKK